MPSVHPRRMSSYLVVDASAATSVAGGVPVAGFIGEDTIKKRIKVLKPVNKPDDKQKAGSAVSYTHLTLPTIYSV